MGVFGWSATPARVFLSVEYLLQPTATSLSGTSALSQLARRFLPESFEFVRASEFMLGIAASEAGRLISWSIVHALGHLGRSCCPRW